jgi:hypothetical protein
MNSVFKNTLLSRCKGDWAVRALISQFLINHRKYMAGQKKATKAVLDTLPTFTKIEAMYWQEQGLNGPPLDGDDDGDDDDGTAFPSGAEVDDGEAAADVGFNGIEGMIAMSDIDGDEDDDDDESEGGEEY